MNNNNPTTRRFTMRSKLTKITLTASIVLAITFTILSCGDDSNPGGGGGKPTTGNAQKDSCIREMAADKTNTPQGIADECGVTQEDIWNLVVNGSSFGTCDSEQLVQYLGNSLSEIEQTCGAEIPKQSSSSNGNLSSSSVALRECVGTPGDNEFCYDGKFYEKCNGYGYDPSGEKCECVYASSDNTCLYSMPVSIMFPCVNGWCIKCGNALYDAFSGYGGANYVRGEEWKCERSLNYESGIYENGVVKYNAGSNVDPNWIIPGDDKKCGNIWYGYPARCENNVIVLACGTGGWYNPQTEYCSNGTKKKYGSTPEIGGRTYKTVEIGSQVWMAENLSYGVKGIKYYMNDSISIYKYVYGGLYDWATAMDISSSCNGQFVANCGATINTPHRGICPSGWHIPTVADWETLINYVGSENGCTGEYRYCAGRYLKARYNWNTYHRWFDDYRINNEDKYGFAALPGSYADASGNFPSYASAYYHAFYGSWWSSSDRNSSNPGTSNCSTGIIMHYNYNQVMSNGCEDKSTFRSVRCVKD
jgi:uncharacterized protein (TIGR02145 family)